MTYDEPPLDEPPLDDMLAPLTERPVNDIDAEHLVLGALMREPEIGDDLAEHFVPERDYYRPGHAVLHATILEMHAAGTPTDNPRNVQTALLAAGHSGRITELNRLIDIWQAGMPAQAAYYARHLARLAQQERFRKLKFTVAQLAQAPDFDTAEAVDIVQRELDDVAGANTAGLPPTLAQLLPDTISRIHHPPATDSGIPTGLPDLDVVYPGHIGGRVTVVGARPGVGKSTLGMQFARHAAIRCGAPTLFVSMEMSRDEIMDRVVSAEAGVALRRVTRSAEAGELTMLEQDRIASAVPRIQDAPLFIDDTPHVSLGYLRHKARAVARKTGLGLIIVDYLQLMETPRGENRQQAVAALSRGLKLLAKDLNVPIVVLAQLNRASTMRSGGRPALADLRESGAVEQDADAVLLLHREEVVNPDTIRVGQCDVLVVKNRHGALRDIVVGWEGEYARCVDVTRLPPNPNIVRIADHDAA